MQLDPLGGAYEENTVVTLTANPAQEPTPDIDATVDALVQERLSETSATSEFPGPTATLGQLVDRTRGAVVRIETPDGVGSGTIFDPTRTPIPQPTVTPGPTSTPKLIGRYRRGVLMDRGQLF